MGLPVDVQQIDIGPLRQIEPRGLVLNPYQLSNDSLAAARALIYGRCGEEDTYDSIAFRTFTASPRKGVSPLQTSAWSAMQRAIDVDRKSNPLVDEILEQQSKLRHRPIGFPSGENFGFVVRSDTVVLERRGQIVDRWTYSLTDWPDPLLMGVVDNDAAEITAQHYQVQLEATHWLPLPALLEEGRFTRFQELRSKLIRDTQPGAWYCFLSHRWLDRAQPDPTGAQAQFAAWQLIAYLLEAVRVADQRGLRQPRRFSRQFGLGVGLRGTPIAESLIVNVLRHALDENSLKSAAAEAASLEAEFADYGVGHAARDTSLAHLRELLAQRPALRALTERMYIWYDYACLPQPPREGADEALFTKGLNELTAAQLLGRTVIMLDDADDYLSRAWCLLEAMLADNAAGGSHLIVGSRRPSTAAGSVEHYFETLLEDRPHMLWRAVLDTELFRIQSPATCMQRLGLRVTDPKDLPFIYQRLRTVSVPTKSHIDDSEIVTGVLPLPAFEESKIVVTAVRSGVSYSKDETPPHTAALDWSEALSMLTSEPIAISAATDPPLQQFDTRPDTPVCHIAVVGACEGEAILIAEWARNHRQEIDELFGVTVGSLSWLASDIAPVGHMQVGTLQAAAVSADLWVFVGTLGRLQGSAGRFIADGVKWSGLQYATVALDGPRDKNVEAPAPWKPPQDVDMHELIAATNIAENPPQMHPGGLFLWQLRERLL
jgi:hypothetical protein